MILLVAALVAGLCLGLVFFFGLWWTVQGGARSRQPGLLFAGSFMLRTALALGGFYLIGHASWLRLVVALIGFIGGRIIVRRFVQHGRLLKQVRLIDEAHMQRQEAV